MKKILSFLFLFFCFSFIFFSSPLVLDDTLGTLFDDSIDQSLVFKSVKNIDKTQVKNFINLIKKLEKKLKEDLKIVEDFLNGNETNITKNLQTKTLNFNPDELQNFLEICQKEGVTLENLSSSIEQLLNKPNDKISFGKILKLETWRKIGTTIAKLIIVIKVIKYGMKILKFF